MAIRDLDAFLPAAPAPLRVLANRGANGIDGMVSSALGAAAASGRPLCLLTGDVAFLHDVGGLLAAAKHAIRATIVVVNDDGGAIFSYLPIAAHAGSVDFDELFRTPHGVDLAHAARLARASYVRADGLDHYRGALKEALASHALSIVEVPVAADANLAQHRAIAAGVTRELAGIDFEAAS